MLPLTQGCASGRWRNQTAPPRVVLAPALQAGTDRMNGTFLCSALLIRGRVRAEFGKEE
jgi:hypothetical protein